MTELKNCQHCGGSATTQITDEGTNYYRCLLCSVRSDSPHEWNARHVDTETKSLIAICLAYLRWFEDCGVCNGLGLINGVVIRHNEEFKNVDK